MGNEQVITTASVKDAASSQAEEAPNRHPDDGRVLNASGHVQELERQFSLVSLAGIGLSVGIVWPAAGGSILVAIFNGGPPGVLYEFIVVSIFYWFIAASIAELASAIPSSAGLYHWATVTAGARWGIPVGFFAGYWNWLAWTFGVASMTSILSNTLVQMYALHHPNYTPAGWHTFVTYIAITWIVCPFVCLFNSAIPIVNKISIVFVLGGFVTTIIIVTMMPALAGGSGHASNAFVWSGWTASIGWPEGVVFVTGMLNDAYSAGTPDCTSHLAEEVANPQRQVPLAILFQMATGFVTGLAHLVAILYSINDYDALFESAYPIATIYQQATNSTAATTGLLALILFCIGITVIDLYVTCGRTLWTLARDGATPFVSTLGRVSPRFSVPINAMLVTAIVVTGLGGILLASTTAFNAFVGSYILMSTASYLAAILPNLLSGRKTVRAYGQNCAYNV